MSCSSRRRIGNRNSRRSGESDNEDRLSNLPDCLISDILSCLPTEETIRTCVLSKAWEYKWTSAYNIRIRNRRFDRDKESDKASFISYVDRILLLSPNIRSFDLSSNEIYDICLSTWISSLFRRNIECVNLCCGVNSYPPDGIILSRSILTCTSLRELKLDLSCTFKVPHKMCFPNLTILKLEDVEILSDNSSTNTLAFVFPVLKTLQLRSCRWLKARFLEFHAPSLAYFWYLSADSEYEVNVHIIKILGARLTKFCTWGPLQEDFILTGSTVQCAVIYNVKGNTAEAGNAGLMARRLFNEFSNLRELVLFTFLALAIAEEKSGLPLPRYDKLRRLELLDFAETRDKYFADVEALFELLHATPFLEYLIIRMERDYEYGDSDDPVMETFDAVGAIPSCIVSHLKKVKFKGYVEGTRKFKLARFLLKKCVQLEKFCAECWGSFSRSELIEKLSKFPRASTCVKFKVIRKHERRAIKALLPESPPH